MRIILTWMDKAKFHRSLFRVGRGGRAGANREMVTNFYAGKKQGEAQNIMHA